MTGEKAFETMVFIVLIMIIGILVFPFFEKIIYSTQDSAVKTNVNTTIDNIKNVYLKENQKLDSIVYLPFKVEYNKDGYKTYCDGKEVNLETKIETKGNKPISGSITWGADNNVIVTNLKFKTHTCNKTSGSDVKCVRDSKK
ncbi:MAG: hypothetical protein IKG40_01920 [Bacilli bacterium]|nr:hypothetical protein [Bacilli bacterium]